ncbi:MAG: hypothetical protein ACKO2G_12995 [Verrucomicrobiales bacterium]
MNPPPRLPRMDRRHFLQTTTLAGLSLPWLPSGVGAIDSGFAEKGSFSTFASDLLRDWCDGMLAAQINDAANPARDGALACPSCDFIHGRCMDAVYPLFHMAKKSGDQKYRDAGIRVFEWGNNVSHDDGSWTVIQDPKSWKGITVFGAIALAETLHHHGDLLDAETRQRWTERLGRAGDYVFEKFTTLSYSNVNYGCTGIYAMLLIGKMLNRPAYQERGRQLASGIKDYLTPPNGLLMGEGKPQQGTSPRGCRPVDLDYNVEESLVAIALAADATKDEELTALAVRLLKAHLEFMLPDGAWDNSWGTRQSKWAYWGSRTCDGCQPGYAVLAKHEPAFATAVVENTRLYRNCTRNGLLHGGPHYADHGAKPCIHHTFTHAKALAALLDHADLASGMNSSTPLPRTIADGVREYPEIASWLVARGPWRATVTTYDWIYKEAAQAPTGGTISMLWHPRVGPLLAGSMARYHMVEPNNMQLPMDDEDHPLTPRVELRQGDRWFTQLYDRSAMVKWADADGAIVFDVTARLLDQKGLEFINRKSSCSLSYRFDRESLLITAQAPGPGFAGQAPKLILPVISTAGEKVVQSDNRIEIHKTGGKVIIEANAPLQILKTKGTRIFNLIPGFEALPIVANLPTDQRLECRLVVAAP